jgi:hypothetical protein
MKAPEGLPASCVEAFQHAGIHCSCHVLGNEEEDGRCLLYEYIGLTVEVRSMVLFNGK